MRGFLHEPESWVLVAFIGFFVLFGRQLWAALAGMLDARAAAIRTELEEASRLRHEAEHMLAEARSERDGAIAEARDLLARSHAEAARLSEAAHADAMAAGQRRERMALDRIAAAEKAAVTEVRQIAAEVAIRAAQTVIAEGLSLETGTALVDQAIADLPRALRAA